MTVKHPLVNQQYTAQDDGTVRVESGKKWGLFDGDGFWVEGSLKSCDPQMCRWLSSGVVMARLARESSASETAT